MDTPPTREIRPGQRRATDRQARTVRASPKRRSAAGAPPPADGPRLVKGPTARPGELSFSGLPSEWQQQSVRRLVYVAAIALGTSILGLLLSFLRQENVGLRAGIQRPVWPILLAIASSASILLVARAEQLKAQFRLDCGLAFLVVFCFLAAYFRHAMPYYPTDLLRGQSPVVFCLLFFAIIVPVSPWRMTIGGVLAVLTDPLALVITLAQGAPVPPWNLWLWLFVPNLVAVVIAVLSSHLLYQVGRSVTEAREMGAYRLADKLGEGGMGEVWQAQHRTLARPAAIKLIRPETLGGAAGGSRERTLRRFELEAQATALLTSPHTIDVFDFGVSSDGSFYYVMELLEGMNLEEMLEVTGPLSPARAAHLLEQICHSLRDAHHAGMVHRDIKPGNVFVCRQGLQWDYVKVLDFGLVKRFDSLDPQITIAGGIVGTPAYMAPEVARGQDAAPPADIYALGCVGYRMLAGRAVFQGRTTSELLIAHVEQTPEPLSDFSGVDVPAPLDDLIMCCLAKDPASRPATIAAVLQALQATGLSAQWTAADAQAWWEPHRG